jgi:hypothetical protein
LLLNETTPERDTPAKLAPYQNQEPEKETKLEERKNKEISNGSALSDRGVLWFGRRFTYLYPYAQAVVIV